jgi:hypothetical protein
LLFDFLAHELVLETSDGTSRTLALKPQSVAEFYRSCMEMLRLEKIDVDIWPVPVEVPDPIRFDQDTVHTAYDPMMVEKFWRILLSVDVVFQDFRSEFIGKSSPVHFFWGSFDLAVTRFSGRKAPERPGADPITREAYSHEVSSVGFWPGGGNVPGAAFYSYAAPAPPGFAEARVRPEAAKWDKDLGEFLLMYDDLRKCASPSRTLLEFCRSTYQAAARFGQWDRGALERTA